MPTLSLSPTVTLACRVGGALCVAVSCLLPATARAQPTASTWCGANGERESGPTTATTSACEFYRSFPDFLDPSFRHDGRSEAWSEATNGAWKARATAVGGGGGEASSGGAAQVQGSFSIVSTDASRLGEQVYVTVAAPRIEVETLREPVVPRQDVGYVPQSSVAGTLIRFDLYGFTLQTGSVLDWSWKDEAYDRNGVGTEHDSTFRSTSDPLAPIVLPMLLGEITSFWSTLSAIANVEGTGRAVADVSRSVYWGGITDVVDAAGRPVDYQVLSGDDADWGRSHVPDVATPVPEPASAVLMGMGALLMVRIARRSGCRRREEGRHSVEPACGMPT